MKGRVEIIARETCHEGFLRLERCRLRHELYAGGMSGDIVREVVERGHAVVVMLYDPLRDCLVMVEQFRAGALHDARGAWLIEFVAGMVEHGEGEEEVARRECMEEAGLVVSGLERIACYYPSPGACTETVSIYCGRVDARGAGGLHGLADEHEDIRVQVLSYEEAIRMLEGVRLRSAAPIIALQWLALNREALRARWLGPQ